MCTGLLCVCVCGSGSLCAGFCPPENFDYRPLDDFKSYSIAFSDVNDSDWGHARDYIKGMWLMVQRDEPEDYVLSTGECHSVKEFVEEVRACRTEGTCSPTPNLSEATGYSGI